MDEIFDWEAFSRRALASFMQNLQERNGEAIGYSVESNLNHEVSYYRNNFV